MRSINQIHKMEDGGEERYLEGSVVEEVMDSTWLYWLIQQHLFLAIAHCQLLIQHHKIR